MLRSLADSRALRRTLTGAALVALLSPAGARAASFRLSDGQAFSDVAGIGTFNQPKFYLPVFSPDGRTVLYAHDADTDDAFELWRVRTGGGTPVRVSGLLPSGSAAFGFHFTPNGQRILYRARQDDADALELYSVPAGAPTGSWTKLNESLAPDSGIVDLGVSPDSAAVAYSVWRDPGARTRELWTAATDGGERHLVVSVPDSAEIRWERVTSSFARFVYIADTLVDDRFELWSVPTAGGTPVKLNGVLTGEGDVQSFDLAPGGARVAYVADQQTNDVFEAYTVPVAGGGPVKVSAALPAGSDVSAVVMLAGGQRLIYLVVAEATGQAELWGASVFGGDAARLHPALGPDRNLAGLAVAPDGSRVAYVADVEQNDRYELYTVPAAGGVPVKLNGAMTAGGDVATDLPVVFTPDSSRVLYVADQLLDGRRELFGAPAAGGTALRLNRTLAAPGEWQVVGFQPTADSSRIAYVLRSRPSAVAAWTEQLYSVPVTAGASTRLDGPTSAGGDLFEIPVVPPVGSARVLYLADQDDDEQFELYVGDACLFCDGFEAGSTVRWAQP
ncbi:MAG: hypothetical protein AMXMBFR36_23910 [Acidobacteriota bacterium]